MSNYANTKQEVKNYICARTPLIIIDSPERERIEKMLSEVSDELAITISYYTDAKQVCSFSGEQSIDVNNDPLKYIASYFKKHRNGTFAFGDVRRISDDNMYSRELLNLLYLAKEMNCTLILITSDTVWPRLAQFGMLTTLEYPDDSERKVILETFINTYKGKYRIEWVGEDFARAATLLRGFTEIQIDNILSTTLITYQCLLREHLIDLTNQKSRLYSANNNVQMVKVNPYLQVAGLDNLKEWLDERRHIFFASDEELSKHELSTPKGILLAGVPGCGKSFSAKMVANRWELPLFRFDIGTIYNKWVGESEKRMQDALRFIDNVSPCVLWIDEIEKALSTSSMGNDTGKRVLGQFLFWLQETNSRVFLVATANDVLFLPYELFRKGRFSELFFIDLPNDEERRSVIELYVKRSLNSNIADLDIDALVEVSYGFSYSDIEYIIKDIAQMLLINPDIRINSQLILNRFKLVIPISKSNPEMISKIRKWGGERAISASKVRKDEIYEK